MRRDERRAFQAALVLGRIHVSRPLRVALWIGAAALAVGGAVAYVMWPNGWVWWLGSLAVFPLILVAVSGMIRMTQPAVAMAVTAGRGALRESFERYGASERGDIAGRF